MGRGAAGDTGPAARSSFQESSGILVLRAVIFLDALRLAYPGNGRRGDGMRGDFRGWYPRKGADSTLKCDHAGGAGIQAIDLVGSVDFCKADLEAVDALA